MLPLVENQLQLQVSGATFIYPNRSAFLSMVPKEDNQSLCKCRHSTRLYAHLRGVNGYTLSVLVGICGVISPMPFRRISLLLGHHQGANALGIIPALQHQSPYNVNILPASSAAQGLYNDRGFPCYIYHLTQSFTGCHLFNATEQLG